MLRVLFVLGILLGSSCDDHAPGYSRVGVRLGTPTSIVVLYSACPGEVVESVTLFQSDGDGVAPDNGDEVVWTGTESDLEELIGRGVLVQSAGEAVVLKSDEEYLIGIIASGREANSFIFELSDLSLDAVWVRNDSLTPEEFARRAAESC